MSILAYIKKLVNVLAGRLPGLPNRSCQLKNALPAEDLRELDLDIPIEDYVAKVQVNPLLLENGFANMAADQLTDASTSTLQANFSYSAKVLNGARVFSDGVTHISVYDADNLIREELSAHHRISPPKTLKKQCTAVYKGTTLHLAAEITTLNGNMFHWLLDAMGRILMLNEKVDQQLAIDRYLIPPRIPRFRESMVGMGIDESKLVELPMGECVEFEKLVWVSNPCGYSSHIVPEWLIQAYVKRFSPIVSKGKSKSTRIYISRQDAITRKFCNEDELAAALQAKGFQIIELSNYGLTEKVRLFSEATEVVGMSGAGLVGLMFCRPGTRVIEMYPSTFVNYNIASISSHLGHDHHPYIFPSNSFVSKLNAFSGEFKLDIDQFMEVYDSIVSQSTAARVSNG